MTNSLYENIQVLGNRMASNLETMGVSASFSDGGLTLADKILEIQSLTDGVFLFENKDILQSGDTDTFTALAVKDNKLIDQSIEIFYCKDSFSNSLTSDSTGFTVIYGDGFSISSNGAYLNNSQVSCNGITLDLATEEIIIQFKAKCDEGGMVNLFMADNQGDDEGTTITYIGYANKFCNTAFSLPSGFDTTEWFDVKILFTNDEQKLWLNGTLVSTTTRDFTGEQYVGKHYVNFYGTRPFSMKDMSILVDKGTIASGSHGAVTGSYTGTGAGELTVMAESGSVVSQPAVVIDGIVYDQFLTDTSSNYYANTNYTTLVYANNSLEVTFGSSARYLRFRTNENNILSALQGQTITFKTDMETSVQTACSIIYSTPTESDVTIGGNTIVSDGELVCTAEIPSNASQVIFNVNTGTTGSVITVKNWLIYLS